MSSDEWFDPELQRRIRAASPPHGDTQVVLEGLRPRMARAKRRRQATIGGGVAALAVVLAGSVLSLSGGDDPTSLDVVSGPSSSIAGPTSVAPSSTMVTTTTAPTTIPTTTALPPTTAPPATGASRPATTSLPDTPTSTAPAAPASTRGTTTSTAATTPPPGTPERRTFTSAGGSLVVLFDGRVLTAPVATPASGWRVEIDKQDPDDVDVRFRRGEESARIRVRVVAGVLVRDDS